MEVMEINKFGAVGSIDEMARCAVNVLDFDEGSDALKQLLKLDPIRARDASLVILKNKIGDQSYRAFAFDILYLISIPDALDYIVEYAAVEDATVIGEMLEFVTDDFGAEDAHFDLMEAASALRAYLSTRSAGDFEQLSERIAAFNEKFS